MPPIVIITPAAKLLIKKFIYFIKTPSYNIFENNLKVSSRVLTSNLLPKL